MKRMVYRYRFSKFKCFLNGLIFAVISIAALLLCLSDIASSTDREVILPFFIAIISMLLGLVSMFHDTGMRKEKI